MKIGIPNEIKPQEDRVGMVPAVAAGLIRSGHEVFVERGAGARASFPDEQYEAVGVQIVSSAADVFSAAEMIVKVKEPQSAEIEMLEDRHILFTYLHLAASRQLTQALTESGCTAIAYETLSVGGRLPLLEPMSEIAGRMSAMVGSYHLANHCGGRGVLLGGVPGVGPGRVGVLGGGTAGVNAARVATGLGADVTILEVDFERMRFIDITMDHTHTIYSTEANLAELLPRADLGIGAVLVPGAAAPKLITREMLRLMPPGSVFVDIAVDQGGCAETTRPTTHDQPIFVEENIVHYCVANMPGAFARTSTQALNNVTERWVTLLARLGVEEACRRHPDVVSAVNCQNGKLTCAPVAEAHELELSATAFQ